MLRSKFIKFLMSILKWQVNSSSNFASFFIVMTHNFSVDFKLTLFLLWIKGSHQYANFETFNCSGENFPYSSCHFPNHKSVFLQNSHHSSVSWKITPLYFLGQTNTCNNFEHFVCSYCCKLFVIIFFHLIPQVMHSVFSTLPCAHVTCMEHLLI